MKNNDLLAAFLTEVSEQLDNLELTLTASDAETTADIHQLFRDFHTIKSSCAMMDFHSMEKIAHASEDYLDLVRKGKTHLTATTINTLLSGIDWLKTQLQRIKNTNEHPQDNIALADTLAQLSHAFATAPEPSPTHHPAITTNNSKRKNTLTELQLSEEELQEFSAACTEELITGLHPQAEHTTIKRSLNKLASICNLLGFSAIAVLLKKYIKASNPLDQGMAYRLAADIMNRMSLLEQHYHIDCGTSMLQAAYLDALFVNFTQLSGRLDYLLDLIEQSKEERSAIEECETLLKYLCINAELFGNTPLLTLFRHILQSLRSIKRQEFADIPAAFYAIRRAAEFPFAEKLQEGKIEATTKELQRHIAELDDSIEQAMYGGHGEDTRQLLRNHLSFSTPDTLESLSPSSIVKLATAIAEEKHISEISIDHTCSDAIIEKIIYRISGQGTVVHSQQKHQEFIKLIIVLDTDFSSFSRSVHNLDIEKNLYTIRNVKKITDTSLKKQEKKQTSHTIATLRVDSATLDQLMTQTGEIIMTSNTLSHSIKNTQLEHAISVGKQWLHNHTNQTPNRIALDTWQPILHTIQASLRHIASHHTKLKTALNSMQTHVLDLRVIPVAAVFNRIPQLVRKMADSQGKKIKLIMEGKQVCIDKGMVDVLMEPLIHLVRNCIDHGIEMPDIRIANGKPAEATLTLSAQQEGSTLTLTICDDGRGINLPVIRQSAIRKGFIKPEDVLSDQEICKLIFLPGFSTAETITETSGRGVGMDVVITRIEHIGGRIDVDTTPGTGTRFTMTLPLSAALQDVVITRAGQHIFAINQSRVSEVLSIDGQDTQRIMGQSVLLLKNTAVPLFYLDELAQTKGKQIDQTKTALQFTPIDKNTALTVIVITQSERQIAVCVDDIYGRENVFVRDLHKGLRKIPSICGATVRSSGELAFILDSQFLLQYANNSILSWINHLEELAI